MPERKKTRLFATKRIALICGLGLTFIAAAVFYQQYFLARPIGNGPAGPVVDRGRFMANWTDRPVMLVGLGDSVTAGLGARTPEHSYFNRLIRNPVDEYEQMKGISLSNVLPNLTSKNWAISGSTSNTHLDVIEEELDKQLDDVFAIVVMTTGGNDLIHSYGRAPAREFAMYGATLEQAEPWIDAFAERLDLMLDKIEAAFPGGCEIYLADIYDPTDGVGDGSSINLPAWPDGLAIHAEYNQVIYQASETRTNVHIVPLYKTFLGHGSHCRQFWRETYVSEDPNFWYYDNIEDPNDRGYDAIRRIFLNSIVANSTLLSQDVASVEAL